MPKVGFEIDGGGGSSKRRYKVLFVRGTGNSVLIGWIERGKYDRNFWSIAPAHDERNLFSKNGYTKLYTRQRNLAADILIVIALLNGLIFEEDVAEYFEENRADIPLTKMGI